MKDLKMFPQITEETEENLLHLEENEDSQLSPKSPTRVTCSAPVSPLPRDTPSPFECEIHPPLATILAEDEELKKTNENSNDEDTTKEPEEFIGPPPRVRMRSLSGGTYQIHTLPVGTGRTRRQSGDDVLSGTLSPSRKAAFFELPEKLHFRPRSKSDSKGKRPTFLSNLKNTFFSTSASNHQRKNSLESDPLEPLQPSGDYRQRSRSGSESKGTVSKMFDIFRHRSSSVSTDLRVRRLSGSSTSSAASALIRRYSVNERRKHLATNIHPQHRSLELTACDQRELETESNVQKIDYENIVEDLYFPKFFDFNSCYSIMPKSGKMVVLNVDLTVGKAFHCLVGNEIRAAPLYDHTKHSFIGMLTITDFIDVLILYYESSEEQMKDLENQTIQVWRNVTEKPNNFIHISPEASLTDAIKALVQKQVHRLPIVEPETNSVLYIITHKRILKYLDLYVLKNKENSSAPKIGIPSYMKQTIRDLGIGTYENIATATLETTVIEALRIFKNRKVSALPVIQDGKVINIYAKFDVLALASEKSYRNLDMTIKQALEQRGEIYEHVYRCTQDDTLDKVIESIVKHEVHRIVIVDSKQAVVGMISLSDIMRYLVLRPLGLLVPSSDIAEGGDDAEHQISESVSDLDPLCENLVDLGLSDTYTTEQESASTSSNQTVLASEKDIFAEYTEIRLQEVGESSTFNDSDSEEGEG